MKPLRMISAGVAGLLLMPVLVIGALTGSFGDGANVAVAADGDLIAQVLGNPMIDLTHNARADVASGAIDERVLAVLLLLAQRHHLGPVGPFITGHTHFVKGTQRVSMHVFGRAVDILGIDGASVSRANAQARRAMIEVLELPGGLRPDEIGGPWILRAGGRTSFTDANHQDHVHLGYETPASQGPRR